MRLSTWLKGIRNSRLADVEDVESWHGHVYFCMKNDEGHLGMVGGSMSYFLLGSPGTADAEMELHLGVNEQMVLKPHDYGELVSNIGLHPRNGELWLETENGEDVLVKWNGWCQRLSWWINGGENKVHALIRNENVDVTDPRPEDVRMLVNAILHNRSYNVSMSVPMEERRQLAERVVQVALEELRDAKTR